MKITSVEPIYLKMPQVTTAADGTQDTLLVRVRTDAGVEGWGECDASPLVSLSVYCCPMSHGNIINIRESLVGERVDSPEDVQRLHARVLRNALDIQQVNHAYSGADIALWDVLGRKLGQPVYRLLGAAKAHAKLPYASVLFGDTPEETNAVARRLKDQQFRAAKFGWGPLGSRDAAFDEVLVRAAREGLGDQAELMVDAGVAWGNNVETVLARAKTFSKYRVTWLEEPLHPDSINHYAQLTRQNPAIPIAAGENCATVRAAEDYIDHAGLCFLQIDAGRIGGITPARKVCELARQRGLLYVNHTFKSHVSLAAALHVFADVDRSNYLEYPAGGSPLAHELVKNPLNRDAQGLVALRESPGLGVDLNMEVVRRYHVPVHIKIDGQVLFESEKP